MLIFVYYDRENPNLIFSDYYKKKTFKLHLFTDYWLLTDWLQIGYKQDLWTFNKIMYGCSFDIDKKKGYNTNHRSEKLRAATCAAIKKRTIRSRLPP